MRTKFILYPLSFLFCSCHHAVPKARSENISLVPIIQTNKKDYSSIKENVLHVRDSIRFMFKKANQDEKEQILASAEIRFQNLAMSDIIPEWYGTPWDFYGNTEQPKKGAVACGYFVTTVLRDCGLKIQRIKLAQCASETMITELVERNDIKRFSNSSISEIKII